MNACSHICSIFSCCWWNSRASTDTAKKWATCFETRKNIRRKTIYIVKFLKPICDPSLFQLIYRDPTKFKRFLLLLIACGFRVLNTSLPLCYLISLFLTSPLPVKVSTSVINMKFFYSTNHTRP